MTGDEATGCTGKIKYPGDSDAKQAVRAIMRRQNERHVSSRHGLKLKFESYHCDFCGYYHVGHRPT